MTPHCRGLSLNANWADTVILIPEGIIDSPIILLATTGGIFRPSLNVVPTAGFVLSSRRPHCRGLSLDANWADTVILIPEGITDSPIYY